MQSYRFRFQLSSTEKVTYLLLSTQYQMSPFLHHQYAFSFMVLSDSCFVEMMSAMLSIKKFRNKKRSFCLVSVVVRKCKLSVVKKVCHEEDIRKISCECVKMCVLIRNYSWNSSDSQPRYSYSFAYVMCDLYSTLTHFTFPYSIPAYHQNSN